DLQAQAARLRACAGLRQPLVQPFQVPTQTGQRRPQLVVQLARDAHALGLARRTQTGHERAQLPARLAQLFLSALALGDVFGDAGDAIDLALLIGHREAAVAYPAHATIGLDDAILQLEGAGALVHEEVHYARTVFPVDRLHEGARRAVETLARAPPD